MDKPTPDEMFYQTSKLRNEQKKKYKNENKNG
jgi:hypothetical protein